MANKEDSSFLQGVESRLDALFGEDFGTQAPSKGPAIPRPAVPEPGTPEPGTPEPIIPEPIAPEPVVRDIPAPTEVAADLREEIREIPIVKTPAFESAASADKIQPQDKSAFISEIEKRFSAIFGDDDKESGPVKTVEKPVTVPEMEAPPQPDFMAEAPSLRAKDPLEDIMAPAQPAMAAEEPPLRFSEPVREFRAQSLSDIEVDTAPVLEAKPQPKAPKEEIVSEFAAPLSSIYNSPLKDMKSIVLSIEWEISDQILEQFDEEINKLYLLYTGNRIILGFLRILRFLGRYIRVRGVSSNQDSINLLLSVYDHLESVMISEGMTEARKHVILLDNIKKYRTWVETTDIETGAESIRPAPPMEEVPAPVETPAFEAAPVVEMPPPEVKPAESGEEPFGMPEPLRLQLEEKEEPAAIREPDIVLQDQPAALDLPVVSRQAQNAIMEAMKSMPIDEAVKYAVERIKNIYQTELDALKEEIRVMRDR